MEKYTVHQSIIKKGNVNLNSSNGTWIMKKHCLLLILVLIGFSSCYKGFYTGETSEDLQIYSSSNSTEPAVIIPAGSTILYRKDGKRKYVACESYSGYTQNVKLRKYKKRNDTERRLLSSTKIYKASIQHHEPSNTRQNVEPTYNGGDVDVKGYYRKNGTYVRPHTRSVPLAVAEDDNTPMMC